MNEPTSNSRAPRNQTITLTDDEAQHYQGRLLSIHETTSPETLLNRTIHQDLFEVIPHLPDQFNIMIRTCKANYSPWGDCFFGEYRTPSLKSSI